MGGWQDELRALASSLGARLRRGANTLERIVDRDPFHIVGYRGYGISGRVLVLGRVLQNEGLAGADPAHSRLRNLFSMLQRLESDPMSHARVRARWPGGGQELVADDEGFIREWLEIETGERTGWQSVELELAAGPGGVTPAPFLVPGAGTSYGVISDMDDTVIQSHVTDFIRAARIVLLENARTRLPFPGVAAFYRALVQGRTGTANNAVFYVSSSPWNSLIPA